jgi:predicted lipoprotein with Yx(FWY)xxD motif
MKTLTTLIALSLLALAACGSDSTASSTAETTSAGTTTAGTAAAGTTIVVRSSDFGRMLFNSKRQAIYIFQRDGRSRSRCYGACAKAWPPVFTKGRPRAGKSVKPSLLGTTKRKDGRLQVTYAGKPLYYYAHEGPGQVLCHNVQLNGGYWWVVGPDGKRRP